MLNLKATSNNTELCSETTYSQTRGKLNIDLVLQIICIMSYTLSDSEQKIWLHNVLEKVFEMKA
jgi:hypothetical protein